MSKKKPEGSDTILVKRDNPPFKNPLGFANSITIVPDPLFMSFTNSFVLQSLQKLQYETVELLRLLHIRMVSRACNCHLLCIGNALLDRHLEAELQSMAAQFTQRGDNEGEGATLQDRSFPVHLEERRTWNVLTLEFFLYALRHPMVQQQLAERYRGARNGLTTLLQGISQAEEDHSAFPIEYLPWALIALGIGLSLQAYLEPGALPPDLYSMIVGRLLTTPYE